MKNFLSPQSASAVVMVRPHRFSSNPQTAADNAFQRSQGAEQAQAITARAYQEVTEMASTLESHGVTVHLFEDVQPGLTPDSVFPNNWFSTHAGGHIAVYPMYCANRRLERRQDVLEFLKQTYRVQDVIDYSGLEHDGLFLEGTGAMVLDHIDRVAYTARSNRANAIALERFATHFNFEPMAFDAVDAAGRAVARAPSHCQASPYGVRCGGRCGPSGLPHECGDVRGHRVCHGGLIDDSRCRTAPRNSPALGALGARSA